MEFSTCTTEVQEDINITVEDIRDGMSKMANRKAAGPDLVQRFWFKKLTGLHSRLQECLQDCICQGNVPEWMVRGRTVLIQKDTAKGTTHGVEALDRSYGREVIPPLGKEWTAYR